MKKLLCSLFLAILAISTSPLAHALDNPDPKGTLLGSAMIGPKFMFGIHSHISICLDPSIMLDYVITDNLGPGHLVGGAGVGAFYFSNIKQDFGDVQKKLGVYLTPRVYYGLNLGGNMEVHAGLSAGAGLIRNQLYYSTGGTKYDHPYSFKFSLGALLGFRYYVSEKLGVTAEIQTHSFAPILGVGVSYYL
ncbi:MAG: hypothetical protein IKO77_06170 [Bacteroidales bacterium]|nr:hypothetical protein [Bacteroidales bacterium]